MARRLNVTELNRALAETYGPDAITAFCDQTGWIYFLEANGEYANIPAIVAYEYTVTTALRHVAEAVQAMKDEDVLLESEDIEDDDERVLIVNAGPLESLIREYLEMKSPEDWSDLSAVEKEEAINAMLDDLTK